MVGSQKRFGSFGEEKTSFSSRESNARSSRTWPDPYTAYCPYIAYCPYTAYCTLAQ